jgi:hypothetical protein
MALTGVALEVCSWWAEPAASGDFVDLHVRSFFLSVKLLSLERLLSVSMPRRHTK